MEKIIGTGLSGMVGSRAVELWGKEFRLFNVSLETGFDILDKDSLKKAFLEFNPSACLHFAARSDVDNCEKEKELGEKSQAFRVNVLGTKNIVEVCQGNGIFLIYISTDFVFGGSKEKPYTEEDKPNPINWYGETKLLGEKEVERLGAGFCIVRIAYPFRAEFGKKKDFVRAILGRLRKEMPVKAVGDHIFTPTFIDDIVWGLEVLVEKKAEGIYHLVGSSHLTPYEAVLKIAQTFGFDQSLIERVSLKEYFAQNAPRPQFLALSNRKLSSYNILMSSFSEGLLEIRRQLEGEK
jgi:dTDP-4-dehydrorhamnose reductase